MHDYSEPSFPLSLEDFRRALHAGRGRARMHLEHHGVEGMEDVILEAAVNCKVYDPQCEGLPSAWFADFCEAANIVPTLLAANPGEDYWDDAWRFALLGQFMLRGHAGAREALYAALVETESGELVGAEDLVELDGSSALVFVAQRLGQMATRKPDLKVDDGPLQQFDSAHEKGAALRLLSSISESDPDVRAYLERLPLVAIPDQVRPRSQHSIEDTIRDVRLAERSMPGLAYRARLFTPDELKPIRDLAHSTLDPIVLENSLRCLSGCKTLPLDEAFAPFLRHERPEVRLLAARVLGRHADEVVRNLGRDLLDYDLKAALELLRCSATPDDTESILQLLPTADTHEQHDIGSSVLSIIEGSSSLRDQRLALYVVEHSPCGMCRRSAIQVLLDWGECPEWVLAEGLHDAFDNVRELAREH